MSAPGISAEIVAAVAPGLPAADTGAGVVPLRILLVEDSEDDALLVRRMIYKIFPSGGVHFQHALSVEQGLEHLARATFDVILSDYRLGPRTGLELLCELHKWPGIAAVIFLTGHGDENVAVQAMKEGAYDYLSKSSLTQERLAQAIRYSLTLRHQQEVLREAQDELRRREERFRALVENSFDATVLLDATATILWASNSNRRVLGYMANDRLGANALGEAHPDDLKQAQAVLAEALRRPGEPIEVCCRVRHADGTWRAIEGVATNRLQEPTVAAIVFNFRDITEKKLAEEALRRSERQYQQLFENASDAILLYDAETERILEANAKACEMYGFSKDELVGRSLVDLAAARCDSRVAAEDHAACNLAEGSLETVHIRRDGSPVTLQVSCSTVEYQGRAAVLSIHRDISERKRAEQEVRRLNRALLALSKCTQAVAQANEESELLETVCRILVQIGGYCFAWVGYADDDEHKRVHPAAQFGDDHGYLAAIQVTWGEDENVRGPCGTAIRSGELTVVRNVEQDHLHRPWALEAHKRGIASALALPLKQAEHILGALTIYAAEDCFDSQEQELLGELASNLAFGIVAVRTRAERQRALEGLTRALQWQQEIFEGSLDAVFITAGDGHIVDANRAACELTGYSENELLKMSLPDLYGTEAAGGTARTAQFAANEPIREIILRARNGGRVDVELSSRRILIGGAAYIHTVARDISETKAAQDALRKLSSAVGQSADMVIITDRTGIIEYVNPAFEAATGYTRQEVIGRTPRVLKSGAHDRVFYKNLWDTILSGKVYRGTLQNHRKNGDIYYAEKTITPMRNAEGVITHFIANDRDITGQKRSEEALRASERRYRLLFERNLAGVFRASMEGEILECNQAMARMFGYERREELQRPDGVDLVIDPAQQEVIKARLAKDGHVVNIELCGKKKDGTPVLLLNSLTLLRDESGAASFIEGTVLDITEQRRLHEQLLQAQKMDAIGQLAGGVAHDFNNLLMVISSYAELMLDRLGPEDGLRRNAEQIQKAARRAADLTRQLMAFSRKQVRAPRVLDLNGVLADVVRVLPRLIGEDIQLAFHPGERLPGIYADPVQIEQVVMNLATNARDAMPHGGALTLETAGIHLDEEYTRQHLEVPAGDYVLLAVSDSGVGIAPDVLPHIFEPFFTTKEMGKGTGLGLATVYGIVKQSGGYIWVYSEPGHGTTFKIYLPPVRLANKRAEGSAAQDTAMRGSETVLLVEDEEAVRESAREYLAGCGYNVLTACNGEEGVGVAEKHAGTIHLLITDVVMPRLSGSGLAERITAARPQAKVLYISGYTENTLVLHGVRELGNLFLQKPFTLKALAQKIRHVLDDGEAAAQPQNEAATAEERK